MAGRTSKLFYILWFKILIISNLNFEENTITNWSKNGALYRIGRIQAIKPGRDIERPNVTWQWMWMQAAAGKPLNGLPMQHFRSKGSFKSDFKQLVSVPRFRNAVEPLASGVTRLHKFNERKQKCEYSGHRNTGSWLNFIKIHYYRVSRTYVVTITKLTH